MKVVIIVFLLVSVTNAVFGQSDNYSRMRETEVQAMDSLNSRVLAEDRNNRRNTKSNKNSFQYIEAIIKGDTKSVINLLTNSFKLKGYTVRNQSSNWIYFLQQGETTENSFSQITTLANLKPYGKSTKVLVAIRPLRNNTNQKDSDRQTQLKKQESAIKSILQSVKKQAKNRKST